MAGAFIGWRRSETFAFQLEILISNKRLHREICSPCQEVDKISLWYVELPLLLRFDLSTSNPKFHLDVGPEVVFSLGGGRTPTMSDSFERFDDLFPVNVGGVIGAGLEFRSAGPGDITLDLRYARWLFPLTGKDEPGGFRTETGGIKSSHQIMIVAGYAFP